MKIRATQAIMECLLEQGVDTVFGYPGGTILNVTGQFCFQRKYLLVQPLIQRQVICHGAQESHTGMSMCIFKSGHQKVSLAIQFDIPRNSGELGFVPFLRKFFLFRHIGDLVVFYPYFTIEDFSAGFHGENSCII